MARLPRVYIEGILYYVTSKSGHDQNLFEDKDDYLNYTSLLDSYKSQYGFRLFSYVLMPTHLHLLVELKNNVSISNIMHDLNGLYTKNYNSRYSKKGHLFQERFKTVLAEKKSYLLPLIRNIHLHPKRAKLCEFVKEYPYSSHPKYMDRTNNTNPDMTHEIDEVFSRFGAGEEQFRAYVEDAKSEEVTGFRKELAKRQILGSKEFHEMIKRTIEENARKRQRQELSKKIRVVYLIVAVVLLAASVLTGFHFYRESTKLRTQFDQTIALYDSTLQMLKLQQKEAVVSDGDADQYAWKIRLTEKALEDLKVEREQELQAAKEIEGFSWKVEYAQVGGVAGGFDRHDTISFKNNHVTTVNFSRLGFPAVTYSRKIKDENVIWETMQSNNTGDTASWHGEWNGKLMKGIVTVRYSNGTVKDFAFRSIEERR